MLFNPVRQAPGPSSNSRQGIWEDRFTWVEESSHSEYAVYSDRHTIAKIVRAVSFDAPEHAHSEAQLSLFRNGNSAVLLTHTATGRSNQTSVAPGSVAFIPHYQPHRTHWRGEGELINIYFSTDYMARMMEDRRSLSVVGPLSYRQEAMISSIGRCILDEFDWSGEIGAEFIDHAKFLIATRLLHLTETHDAKGQSGQLSAKRLEPALEVLNARSEDHFTLGELANLCGVSVFHFARSFKARFGAAPFVYQRTLRLQKARNLLDRTNLSIEAVGMSVGFESASHFSRLFHRETGVSPSKFRHMRQNAFTRRVGPRNGS